MRALRRSRLEVSMHRKYTQAVLAKNIKALRLKHKLTQKELGELLSKTESTVRMWELGQSIPPLMVAVDMAVIFEVSLNYLVGLDTEK